MGQKGGGWGHIRTMSPPSAHPEGCGQSKPRTSTLFNAAVLGSASDGQPDLKIFAFTLESADDLPKFSVGQVVELKE